MEHYRIYDTTDHKFIGKTFTVDEVNKKIDIIGVDAPPEYQTYRTIKKYSNIIIISNVNYTIKGKRV